MPVTCMGLQMPQSGVTVLHMGNEKSWREAVSAALRAERAARHWTQQDVYERARMPRSTYVRLESGARSVDVDQLADLARAFNMSASDLVRIIEARHGEVE